MSFLVADILALHKETLGRWSALQLPVEAPRAAAVGPPMMELVEAGHFANFTIWGLEDEARRRDVGDVRIAAVKRVIDPWNQRRNDLTEALDAALLQRFATVDISGAQLHSETAGMMVDRLSILALKIRNMDRVFAEALGHGDEPLATECAARARVLCVQREDLAGCLQRLLEDFAAGRRFFKHYHQLKSYNDPRLNPALRAGAARQPAKDTR